MWSSVCVVVCVAVLTCTNALPQPESRRFGHDRSYPDASIPPRPPPVFYHHHEPSYGEGKGKGGGNNKGSGGMFGLFKGFTDLFSFGGGGGGKGKGKGGREVPSHGYGPPTPVIMYGPPPPLPQVAYGPPPKGKGGSGGKGFGGGGGGKGFGKGGSGGKGKGGGGYGPPPPLPKPSYGPPPKAPKASYGPPPKAPKASYGPPPKAPKASYGPPPKAPKASYGPPPQATYGPPPPPEPSYGIPEVLPSSGYGAPKPIDVIIQQSGNNYGPPPLPPNGNYGAPPPPPNGNYGPPPPPPKGNYGAPPPPPVDNYGAPPPPPGGDYGAPPPPPVDNYGAPPPPPGGNYGAPPPPPVDNYGAPPPPPVDNYGAPPPLPSNNYGAPPELPPVPTNNYNAPPPPPPPPQPINTYQAPQAAPPPPPLFPAPSPVDNNYAPPPPPLFRNPTHSFDSSAAPQETYGVPVPAPSGPPPSGSFLPPSSPIAPQPSPDYNRPLPTEPDCTACDKFPWVPVELPQAPVGPPTSVPELIPVLTEGPREVSPPATIPIYSPGSETDLDIDIRVVGGGELATQAIQPSEELTTLTQDEAYEPLFIIGDSVSEGDRDPRVMEDEALVTLQTITDIPEDPPATYFTLEDETPTFIIVDDETFTPSSGSFDSLGDIRTNDFDQVVIADVVNTGAPVTFTEERSSQETTSVDFGRLERLLALTTTANPSTTENTPMTDLTHTSDAHTPPPSSSSFPPTPPEDLLAPSLFVSDPFIKPSSQLSGDSQSPSLTTPSSEDPTRVPTHHSTAGPLIIDPTPTSADPSSSTPSIIFIQEIEDFDSRFLLPFIAQLPSPALLQQVNNSNGPLLELESLEEVDGVTIAALSQLRTFTPTTTTTTTLPDDIPQSNTDALTPLDVRNDNKVIIIAGEIQDMSVPRFVASQTPVQTVGDANVLLEKNKVTELILENNQAITENRQTIEQQLMEDNEAREVLFIENQARKPLVEDNQASEVFGKLQDETSEILLENEAENMEVMTEDRQITDIIDNNNQTTEILLGNNQASDILMDDSEPFIAGQNTRSNQNLPLSTEVTMKDSNNISMLPELPLRRPFPPALSPPDFQVPSIPLPRDPQNIFINNFISAHRIPQLSSVLVLGPGNAGDMFLLSEPDLQGINQATPSSAPLAHVSSPSRFSPDQQTIEQSVGKHSPDFELDDTDLNIRPTLGENNINLLHNEDFNPSSPRPSVISPDFFPSTPMNDIKNEMTMLNTLDDDLLTQTSTLPTTSTSIITTDIPEFEFTSRVVSPPAIDHLLPLSRFVSQLPRDEGDSDITIATHPPVMFSSVPSPSVDQSFEDSVEPIIEFKRPTTFLNPVVNNLKSPQVSSSSSPQLAKIEETISPGSETFSVHQFLSSEIPGEDLPQGEILSLAIDNENSPRRPNDESSVLSDDRITPFSLNDIFDFFSHQQGGNTNFLLPSPIKQTNLVRHEQFSDQFTNVQEENQQVSDQFPRFPHDTQQVSDQLPSFPLTNHQSPEQFSSFQGESQQVSNQFTNFQLQNQQESDQFSSLHRDSQQVSNEASNFPLQNQQISEQSSSFPQENQHLSNKMISLSREPSVQQASPPLPMMMQHITKITGGPASAFVDASLVEQLLSSLSSSSSSSSMESVNAATGVLQGTFPVLNVPNVPPQQNRSPATTASLSKVFVPLLLFPMPSHQELQQMMMTQQAEQRQDTSQGTDRQRPRPSGISYEEPTIQPEVITEQQQPILLVVEDGSNYVEEDQFIVPLVNTGSAVGIPVQNPVTSFAPQVTEINGGVVSVGDPVFLSESTGQALQGGVGGGVVSVSDPQFLSVSQPQVLSVSEPQFISVSQPQAQEVYSDGSQTTGSQPSAPAAVIPATLQVTNNFPVLPQPSPSYTQVDIRAEDEGGAIQLIAAPVLTSQDIDEELRIINDGTPQFISQSQGGAGQSSILSLSDPQFVSVSQPQSLSVSQPVILSVDSEESLEDVSDSLVSGIQSAQLTRFVPNVQGLDFLSGGSSNFGDGGVPLPVFQSSSQGQPGPSEVVSVSDSQVQSVGQPQTLSVSQPQVTAAELSQTYVQSDIQSDSGARFIDDGSSVSAGVPLFQTSSQGQPGESQFVSVSDAQVQSVGEPLSLSVSQPQITQARYEGNSLNVQEGGAQGGSSIVPYVPLFQTATQESQVTSVSEAQLSHSSVQSDFQSSSGGRFINEESSVSAGVPLFQSSSQGQGQSQFVSVSNSQVESVGQPQTLLISEPQVTGVSDTQPIVKANVEQFFQQVGAAETQDYSSISHESGTSVLPGNFIGSHTLADQQQSHTFGDSQVNNNFRFGFSSPVSSVVLGNLVGSVTRLPGHQFDTSNEDLDHDSQEHSSSILPGNLVGSVQGLQGQTGSGFSSSGTRFSGSSSDGFVSESQPQGTISQSQLLQSTFSSSPSQENIGIPLLPKVNTPDMGSLPLADSSSPQFSSNSPSFPPFSGDLEPIDVPANELSPGGQLSQDFSGEDSLLGIDLRNQGQTNTQQNQNYIAPSAGSSGVNLHTADQQLEATTNTAKSPNHSQVSNSVNSHTSSTNTKKGGRFGFTRRDPPTRRPNLRTFQPLSIEESSFQYSAPGQRVLVSLGARARRQRPRFTSFTAESTDSVRPTRGALRTSGVNSANSFSTKEKDWTPQQDNIKSTLGREKKQQQQPNTDINNTSASGNITLEQPTYNSITISTTTTTTTTTEKPNGPVRIRPITRFRPIPRRRPGSLSRQRGTRKFRQNVSLYLSDNKEQTSTSDENTDSTTDGDLAQAEPGPQEEQEEGEKKEEEVAVDESSGEEGTHEESDHQHSTSGSGKSLSGGSSSQRNNNGFVFPQRRDSFLPFGTRLSNQRRKAPLTNPSIGDPSIITSSPSPSLPSTLPTNTRDKTSIPPPPQAETTTTTTTPQPPVLSISPSPPSPPLFVTPTPQLSSTTDSTRLSSQNSAFSTPTKPQQQVQESGNVEGRGKALSSSSSSATPAPFKMLSVVAPTKVVPPLGIPMVVAPVRPASSQLPSPGPVAKPYQYLIPPAISFDPVPTQPPRLQQVIPLQVLTNNINEMQRNMVTSLQPLQTQSSRSSSNSNTSNSSKSSSSSSSSSSSRTSILQRYNQSGVNKQVSESRRTSNTQQEKNSDSSSFSSSMRDIPAPAAGRGSRPRPSLLPLQSLKSSSTSSVNNNAQQQVSSGKTSFIITQRGDGRGRQLLSPNRQTTLPTPRNSNTRPISRVVQSPVSDEYIKSFPEVAAPEGFPGEDPEKDTIREAIFELQRIN
ncbi:hypothetical protein Pcinc_016420 [Petrolisthes cinctipes]|uniref:Mucin-like domain-containing protein n=1 Tax=Petrolisthes cinctipes TaxID=88211 RepID=A0AAE1KLW8_PETCI|nr:hypothetical protein Pcinc_016420 [Petrolisthes cinctipes]